MKKFLAVFAFGLISTSAFAFPIWSIPWGYHCNCVWVEPVSGGMNESGHFSCGPWIANNVRGASVSNTARVSGAQPASLGNVSVKQIPALYKPQFDKPESDPAKVSGGGPVTNPTPAGPIKKGGTTQF
jgi:hypothetical protein